MLNYLHNFFLRFLVTTSKLWGPHTTVLKVYANSFWPIKTIRFMLLFTRNDEKCGDYDDDDDDHHHQ